jgi:phosphohistidine phosphatase
MSLTTYDKNIRLVLLRHSLAEPPGFGVNDHARRISPNGHALALKRSRELLDLGWAPELVLLSDATRALQTWETMKQTFGDHIPAVALPSLYLGGLEELQTEITSHHQNAMTIFALGHNPGWSDAAMTLTHTPIALSECGSAMLTCNASDWREAIWKSEGWELYKAL